MRDQRQAQLAYYVRLGWAIIPLKATTKGAAIQWKDIVKPPTEAEVMVWNHIFGIINWAVILGPSNLVCLDIDDVEAFDRYATDLGADIPATAMVDTPGGRHYYFKQGALDVDRAVPKPMGFAGEYRAGRSIVKLPFLKNGYTWMTPPSILAPVPQWLRELTHARTAPRPAQPVNQSPNRPENLEKWMDMGFNPEPASRHDYLVKINRALIADNLSPASRAQVLLGINKNFKAGPKEESEVIRLARWEPM